LFDPKNGGLGNSPELAALKELEDLRKKVEMQGDIFSVLKEIKDLLLVRENTAALLTPSATIAPTIKPDDIIIENSKGPKGGSSNQEIRISSKTL
jgi:hypothetical protein